MNILLWNDLKNFFGAIQMESKNPNLIFSISKRNEEIVDASLGFYYKRTSYAENKYQEINEFIDIVKIAPVFDDSFYIILNEVVPCNFNIKGKMPYIYNREILKEFISPTNNYNYHKHKNDILSVVDKCESYIKELPRQYVKFKIQNIGKKNETKTIRWPEETFNY